MKLKKCNIKITNIAVNFEKLLAKNNGNYATFK